MIGVGTTLNLTASIEPNNATIKELEWTSSNHAVAKVDSNGQVTTQKEGDVVITAKTTDGSELEATCDITVIKADGSFSEEKGVNIPKLGNGMMAIIWDENANEGQGDWVTPNSVNDWYKYSEEDKKWAKGATKESRIYATESIRMIAKYWKSYVFEDCRYREIMYAANLSGKAIHISRTTAPHALSYGLTSLYGINHGYAAALCMEQVWKYMLEQADKAKDSHTKMAESLTCCLNSISAIMPYQGFCKIMNALEMEKPLSKDKEGDIAILAGKVNVERLGNHPIVLDKQTIVNFYERIVKQVED